tara:strand:+ start:1257 stop:2714 length:1458 start_codon:yes stop_codon:yes gene_type:complete
MSLKAQLEELNAKRDGLLDQAKALIETGQDKPETLTEEVNAKIDDFTAKAKTADEELTALVETQAANAVRFEAVQAFADRSDEIGSARGIHPAATPAGEPAASTKLPARVLRHGIITNFTGDTNGVSAQERAYRFGQYAMAKLSADMPGKFHFPQALAFARDQFGCNPMAVHGEGGSDTTGSHVFVPDEFGTDLIKLREIYGVARGVFNMRTMSSDTRSDPRRTGGLTAYFVGENAAGTESDAAYDSVSLTAQKLIAVTRVSSELNEDSVIDFGNELAGEISYAFSNKEDECAFNGDGTSTYGGISGVRARLATLTAATATNGLVEATGATWASIVLKDLEKVLAALPQYADVPGQVSWICHKTFVHTVMHSLQNAAGGNTKADIVSGGVESFLGYPVRFSQVYPASTAVSSIPVTLGNYRQGASFGDRRMESISFSDSASVGGQSLWERDQIGVKGTQRFDINVHDIGSATAPGPIVGLETKAS